MYAGADVTTVSLSQGEGRPRFVGQRLICGCATSRGVTAALGWDWGPQVPCGWQQCQHRWVSQHRHRPQRCLWPCGCDR